MKLGYGINNSLVLRQVIYGMEEQDQNINMTQKYLTWNRYWVSKRCAIDADMQVAKVWPKIKFTPLSYGETPGDMRMLAVGSYVAEEISDNAWDKFKNNFSHFGFYEITAGSAVGLCNEWYSPGAGSEFTLDEDGFTIVDNRLDNKW